MLNVSDIVIAAEKLAAIDDPELALCQSPQGWRVIHVDYYRVVDSPAVFMTEVHAGLGIDSPQEVRVAVANWRNKNPKNARDANPYSVERFGINPDEAAELYGDYICYFHIPREQEGLQRVSR